MDVKNKRDESEENNGWIDRHGCLALDVNGDRVVDMVCLVGANKGKGFGYNELYLTKSDGTLKKVTNHGLQKYPSMRARLIGRLVRERDKSMLLFVSAEGHLHRSDGKPSQHRMFRLLKTKKPPYFKEVNSNIMSLLLSSFINSKNGVEF